ncbi:hypothetical protein L484_019208 [Morus notabilis]|uniref:DYW domain-containing protein n=1 Tax=Morus notabilis TaxID=981085 RepID=W9QQY8_9ROSA|nr:hypothetical protein L484_019208 [Morus notabilis]
MLERNEYTWSTTIAAFSQRGRLNDALSLYERATEKGVATRTTMMAAYARSGNIHEARRMFDDIINPSVVTWNAIIAGYAQNGMLEEAKDMFMRVPLHNSASWAALISGFAQSAQYREALNLFAELHRSGTDLSRSCFTSALFACTKSGDVVIGQQIHSLTIKTRCQFNLFVGNGLISLYGKCKNAQDISQVFSIMRARDRVSWNPFITGLPHKHMLKEARTIFEKMSKWDVVSWTSIISAYEQAGEVETASKLFLEMLARGTKPNELTAISLLSACGRLGATRLGEQIHVMIRKLGLNSCLGMCNALMTMYFKCGSLDGLYILERCRTEIFHAGLMEKGMAYFNSMSQDYGITPLVHHYTSMIDLLGRAGRLTEAEALIENMPVKLDSVIWKALLAACWIHRDNKVGLRVAERLFKMEPQRSGSYVLLSNMYTSQGMWEKVREMRELMKDDGISKEPAVIQIRNEVHCFRMGDKAHYEFEEINTKLNDLYQSLKAIGYVPDTNSVHHDVEEEQKQDELLYHSEKLAVVYGIMHTPDRGICTERLTRSLPGQSCCSTLRNSRNIYEVPPTNPSVDYPSGDSDHVSKRTSALWRITDQVLQIDDDFHDD